MGGIRQAGQHSSAVERRVSFRARGVGAARLMIGTLAFVSAPARADDVADFYRDHPVNLILSTGEGGGYASYAQAFAPYFSKHMPGNPRVVIQNMPGAGGIRAMLHFASAAPRDGATIGFVHSGVPFAPLFGVKGAAFDAKAMNYIGAMSRAASVCSAWATSGVATWNDLLTKEFIVGSSGAGSQMETHPAALNRFFGTHIKIISGYKGGNDIYLAMERGEVQGRCGSPYSSIELSRPGWVTTGKVKIPIQFAMRRDPAIPDSPTVMELAPNDAVRATLELIMAPQEMNRPWLAPRDVPPARLAALRAAFHAGMNDPGFVAEAARLGLEIEETSGEEVAGVVARAYAMPDDIVRAAKDAMNLTGAE